MSDLPACCFADQYAPLAEQLYAAYNRGGDPVTAGLNYQGKPCPEWNDLPDNIRAKWEAVAQQTRIAVSLMPGTTES